jgi:hypothetical protein
MCFLLTQLKVLYTRISASSVKPKEHHRSPRRDKTASSG